MLSRLPTALKTRFKLAFPCRDDEHTNVGLGRAPYHVWHIGLVTWSIQDGPPSTLRFEVGPSNLHSLAFCLFFFVGIHNVGQEPAFTILVLGLLHVLLNGPLINTTTQVEHVPTSGGFASVNMANEHNVQVGSGIWRGKLLPRSGPALFDLLWHLLLDLDLNWRRFRLGSGYSGRHRPLFFWLLRLWSLRLRHFRLWHFWLWLLWLLCMRRRLLCLRLLFRRPR
mmetsp:Transcript_77614/g.180000  ORF Transcript_77614/g.180000 Transcript_77614/m.180000 type:complete len:224 (-) Transcript_77614:333-1004(-)